MGATEKRAAEFSLRRHSNPCIYGTTVIPPLESQDSDDSAKLTITSVLRDISDLLIQGRVNEAMLDLLETLEELLQLQGSIVSGTLISAYCWTAVESTLRFMWPDNASDGIFGDVLERIWRKRIGLLKEKESDLVSDELLKWESDFDKADMYQKIREMNIRYNAMFHLNQLVNELGCYSLESEARLMFGKRNVSIRGRNLGRDSVNQGEGVKNEQEEPSVHDGERTVVRELRDWLADIEGEIGLYHPSTGKGKETNSVVDLTIDVTPPPNQANRTKSGGGNQGTSSSSSPAGVRPYYLPTPVPLNVLPLKIITPAKRRPRRPVRFWTPEEVEALREGVKEYGKSWKAIKDSYPLVFADRTEVDLKDKWRNLNGRH